MTEGRAALILDVDDRVEARTLRTRALRQAGFEVMDASGGHEALALASSEQPDLMVLHVHLPELDGLEVCRRLKSDPRTASIPVLHVSAIHTDREHRVAALDNGADGYLAEPVEPSELVATVRALLRSRLAAIRLRQTDELIRSLFEAAPVLIVGIDRDGRIVLFNRGCERLTGYRRDEMIGRPLLELLPSRWGERTAAFIASAGPEALAAPHEHPWLTQAGEERLIEWRCFVTTDSQGERFTFGVGHDVTERHQANARQFVQFSVTRVLADARSIDEAAPALLEAVCMILRWDVGEFWAVDTEGTGIRRDATWAGWIDASRSGAETGGRTVAPGVGLAGQAWLTGKPVWMTDVQADPAFIDRRAARDAGLRTAFAFPVLIAGEVLAVLAFFSQTPREMDPLLLAAMADIGEQVGQFIRRTRADAALRASEARLRLALEAARMGWWEWDVESGAVSWSPELDRLFGLAPGSFQGTHETFLALVHPEDRAGMLDAFDRVVQGSDEYEAAFRVIRADGTTRWAAVRGRVIRDEDGRPRRMIGVDRDITAAKSAEEERTRLAELGRALNESLDLDTLLPKVADAARQLCNADAARVSFRDSPVYRVEADGVHRYDDPALRLEPGLGIGGYVLRTGRPFRTDDYATDPRLAAVPWARVQALAPGIVSALAVPIHGFEGIEGNLGVYNRTPRPFTDRDEAMLLRLADYAGVACRNARMYQETEVARAEAEAARAEAEKANRAKDRFLAMLSHELRNPLASITSAVASLERLGLEEPEAVRLRDIIRRQAGHIGRLLEDLLDMTRLAFGKLAILRETLDLNELARRGVEALEASGRLTVHSVSLRTETHPVPVEGDRVRLEQIIDNLLDNAVKYSPVGRPIRVEVTRTEIEAVLRVQDEGVGLDPDALERIFEPFTQLGPVPAGGLGLGLAVVRGLVRQHGGTVVVRSPGPGRGSEFEVRLPLTAEPAARPSRAEPAARARARRLVVVEDSADTRQALAAFLELLGHRVEAVATGEQAVELILGTRPEIALVDLGLPDIDGYEVARRVRAGSGRAVYLVALTGYGGSDDQTRAWEAGFDRHLVKPVEPSELERVIVEAGGGPPRPDEAG